MTHPPKTRVLRKVAALSVALFWSTGLFAAKDMTKEYLTCVGKAEGVTDKTLDCISAEFGRQDTRLNDAYKKLFSKLSKDPAKSPLKRNGRG